MSTMVFEGVRFQCKANPGGPGRIKIYDGGDHGQEFGWHIDFIQEIKAATPQEIDSIIEKYYKGRRGTPCL